MTSHDPIALARELTNEQFDLLVRARLQAAFNELDSTSSHIMLSVSTGYRDATIDTVQWHITAASNDTKGEVLGYCVKEHIRRHNWHKTSSLRLIEGTTVEEDNT